MSSVNNGTSLVRITTFIEEDIHEGQWRGVREYTEDRWELLTRAQLIRLFRGRTRPVVGTRKDLGGWGRPEGHFGGTRYHEVVEYLGRI